MDTKYDKTDYSNALPVMRFLILILLFIFGHIDPVQSQSPQISYDNFELEVVRMIFRKSADVSQADFDAATKMIEELTARHKGDPELFTTSIYWKYCEVFYKLQLFEHLEISFFKTFDSDKKVLCTICDEEYEERYGPHIDEEQLQDLLAECSQVEMMLDSFDPAQYAAANGYDKDLVAQMAQIMQDDQKFRNSDREKQSKLDNINMVRIDALYGKYRSYIGKSMVGDQLSQVMWSVIHHAKTSDIEKYLDVLYKAVDHGELMLHAFQMAIDRYYSDMNGYQIFGSEAGIAMAPQAVLDEVRARYDIE